MTDHQPRRKRSDLYALARVFSARHDAAAVRGLLPWLQWLGLALAGFVSLAVAAIGFWWSWPVGLAGALILAPLLFFVLAVALHLLLAFVAAVFNMSERMAKLDARLVDIATELQRADDSLGRVDYNVEALNRRIRQIHEEIPRLSFWRRSGDRSDKNK